MMFVQSLITLKLKLIIAFIWKQIFLEMLKGDVFLEAFRHILNNFPVNNFEITFLLFNF